jgi:hypothetical protein
MFIEIPAFVAGARNSRLETEKAWTLRSTSNKYRCSLFGATVAEALDQEPHTTAAGYEIRVAEIMDVATHHVSHPSTLASPAMSINESNRRDPISSSLGLASQYSGRFHATFSLLAKPFSKSQGIRAEIMDEAVHHGSHPSTLHSPAMSINDSNRRDPISSSLGLASQPRSRPRPLQRSQVIAAAPIAASPAGIRHGPTAFPRLDYISEILEAGMPVPMIDTPFWSMLDAIPSCLAVFCRQGPTILSQFKTQCESI